MSHYNKALLQEGRRTALVIAMIREFGERAAAVARAEEEKSSDDVADAWATVAALIERRLSDCRFHAERHRQALDMAEAAASPMIRKLHCELAALHAVRARRP